MSANNSTVTTHPEINKTYVDAAGGVGCYVSYKYDCRVSNPPCCIAGFDDKGSLGSWGYCYRKDVPWDMDSDTEEYKKYNRHHFRPPAGDCGTEAAPFNWTSVDVGEAYACCQ
jgi:hypothetical protein